MITIARLDDVEEARTLHELAFPADTWVGDDHTFWVAKEEGRVMGFCSAIHWEGGNLVFLSRAAVVKSARGRGLHKRMIQARCQWAWKSKGAVLVITYTTLQNYASMTNLLATGFKFYKPANPWVGNRVHYFRLGLD